MKIKGGDINIDVTVYVSCRRGSLHCSVKHTLFRASSSISFIQVMKKQSLTFVQAVKSLAFVTMFLSAHSNASSLND